MEPYIVLPDFVLPRTVNKLLEYTGLDSLDQCVDKKHFLSYPHTVSYKYNSRGFRDSEWPNNQLDECVWCLGDSFTVGLGSPVEHTWPYQVGQLLNSKVINVSMDGASNSWLARKALKVLEQIKPNIMIIQWSFLHRGELDDTSLSDEARRVKYTTNFHNYIELVFELAKLVKQIEAIKDQTKVIHSFVPDIGIYTDIDKTWMDIAGPDWPSCPSSLEELNNLNRNVLAELKNDFKVYDIFQTYFNLFDNINYLPEVKRLDLARDGYHYDILTAQKFAIDVRDLLHRQC